MSPSHTGLVRRGDPQPSHDAADAIATKLTPLQAEVLAAFQGCEMSARQAERLPQFATLAPSTIRKRVSELHKRGSLYDVGRVEKTLGTTGSTIYGVTTGVQMTLAGGPEIRRSSGESVATRLLGDQSSPTNWPARRAADQRD